MTAQELIFAAVPLVGVGAIWAGIAIRNANRRLDMILIRQPETRTVARHPAPQQTVAGSATVLPAALRRAA